MGSRRDRRGSAVPGRRAAAGVVERAGERQPLRGGRAEGSGLRDLHLGFDGAAQGRASAARRHQQPRAVVRSHGGPAGPGPDAVQDEHQLRSGAGGDAGAVARRGGGGGAAGWGRARQRERDRGDRRAWRHGAAGGALGAQGHAGGAGPEGMREPALRRVRGRSAGEESGERGGAQAQGAHRQLLRTDRDQHRCDVPA
ncbi:hypothetical protein X551_04584 [Methylibium sp. T29]|nr:hypothetical protein X551_04584 [Methylibium sp. T29]EWS57330.1 hypothetical protein Y694_04643 [Methylibium sp. T29-B]